MIIRTRGGKGEESGGGELVDVRRLQSGDISRDRDVRRDQRDEVICIRVISGAV